MASEYWYKVRVYGGTELEQDGLLHLISQEFDISDISPYGTQEWGGVWNEADMNASLLPLSAQFPHILIMVEEDCNTYDDDHLLEYVYFGNGKRQATKQTLAQDVVGGELLAEGFDKSALPATLVRNGVTSISANGGLYKLEPISSCRDEVIQITFEQSDDRKVTLLPLAELLDYVERKQHGKP